MKENHKFKIGDHVMHMPTGTHTVWEISGYSENGYRVKEHLDSVRILYEKEDEWELYDSDKYQSLINNKELCLERKTKQTTDIIKVLAKEKRPPTP